MINLLSEETRVRWWFAELFWLIKVVSTSKTFGKHWSSALEHAEKLFLIMIWPSHCVFVCMSLDSSSMITQKQKSVEVVLMTKYVSIRRSGYYKKHSETIQNFRFIVKPSSWTLFLSVFFYFFFIASHVIIS